MDENPYESPREELIPPSRRQSLLIATVRGWLAGGLAGAVFGFFFINPLWSHFPSDKSFACLVALGAVIGGAISRTIASIDRPESDPDQRCHPN
jgi:hypothetical protein